MLSRLSIEKNDTKTIIDYYRKCSLVYISEFSYKSLDIKGDALNYQTKMQQAVKTRAQISSIYSYLLTLL